MTKIFYRAPNNASVVMNPIGPVLTDQAAHSVDVNGRAQIALVAKLLQAQALLADADPNLLVWWLDHEEQSAILYGVDPTGATDSLAALVAVYRAAIAAGGAAIQLPRRGLIQVSDTWLVGRRFVNEADVGYGPGQASSYDQATSYNASYRLEAQALPTVPILGRGSTLWWGAGEPTTEKAILHYAMPAAESVQGNMEESGVRDLGFAGPAAYSAGVLQSPSTSVPPTTKVMGLFAPGSAGTFKRLTARELRRGVVLSGCYWSRLEKVTAWHCGRGVVAIAHNAADGSSLKASYCAQGFELAGQGATFSRLDTEQCGTPYAGMGGGSLWVPECDQLSIRGTYLESVGAAVKDYSIRFGLPVNLLKYSEQFDNNAAWGYVSSGTVPTVSPNAAVAPDGSTTADQLTFAEAVPDGGHWDYFAQNAAITPGTYTLSVFLKAGTSSSVNLQVSVTGGSGTTGVACALTSTWQRFTLTFTAGAGATAALFVLGDNGIGPYTLGLGTVFAWGAMLNAGASAQPYRSTAAAANTAGAGIFWAHLADTQLASEQGRTMDLIAANLLLENCRFYDQGSDALRASASGACVVSFNACNIPFQAATGNRIDFHHHPVQLVEQSISATGVAAGASFTATITAPGVANGAEVGIGGFSLPAGWSYSAYVSADNTIVAVVTNISGSTQDFPARTVQCAWSRGTVF